MTTFSAREFNQDVSAAKRAAETGPVIITDRGWPSHVLLTITDYHHLTGHDGDLVDRLSMDDDVELDPRPLALALEVPEL